MVGAIPSTAEGRPRSQRQIVRRRGAAYLSRITPFAFAVAVWTSGFDPAGASTSPYNPVATSGYDKDIVAEASPPQSHTTAAVDGSDYVLYSTDLPSAMVGLPASGTIVSGDRTYQLQPYAGNNALVLTAGQSATLTLNTPGDYRSLSLLAFSTEGAGTADITVHFDDSSSTTFSAVTVPDWFSGGGIISGVGRIGRTFGPIENYIGSPSLYALVTELSSVDRVKVVTGVSVRNTSSTTQRIVVMAVSGTTTPPVPTLSEMMTALLAVLLAGAAIWSLRRRFSLV